MRHADGLADEGLCFSTGGQMRKMHGPILAASPSFRFYPLFEAPSAPRPVTESARVPGA